MATREVYDSSGNLIHTESIPDPPARTLFPVDIVALFHITELSAVEQSTNLGVIAFRVQFLAAVNPIALDDPRFVAAVAIMRSQNILSDSRAAEVLAGASPQQ
jgi:hypothetical protein